MAGQLETDGQIYDHLEALNQSVVCGQEIFGNKLIDKVREVLDETILLKEAKGTYMEVPQLYNKIIVIIFKLD